MDTTILNGGRGIWNERRSKEAKDGTHVKWQAMKQDHRKLIQNRDFTDQIRYFLNFRVRVCDLPCYYSRCVIGSSEEFSCSSLSQTSQQLTTQKRVSMRLLGLRLYYDTYGQMLSGNRILKDIVSTENRESQGNRAYNIDQGYKDEESRGYGIWTLPLFATAQRFCAPWGVIERYFAQLMNYARKTKTLARAIAF